MRLDKLSAIAIAAVIVAGCNKAEQAPPPPPPGPPPSVPGIATLPPPDTTGMTHVGTQGLMIKELVPGHGGAAHAGQRVAIHYVGTLTNGTQFDANGPSDQPFSFVLGTHAVVDGFDQAVTGMKVGGKRRVIIPPALGYGPGGNGPVPPNANMVFVIDLVSAQ